MKVIVMWGFDEEREFLENLLHTRIQFFIAVFGGFFAAGYAGYASENCYLSAVLSFVGLVVCVFLALPIVGTQWKVNILLDKLRENADHPINYHELKTSRANARNFIGVLLPIFCIFVLFVCVIYFFAACPVHLLISSKCY